MVQWVGGPCWHKFLARFSLEVVYIKGEDNGAADVLSRWAYPAYLANPDINLPTKRVGMHLSGKLRSGSTQSLQG